MRVTFLAQGNNGTLIMGLKLTIDKLRVRHSTNCTMSLISWLSTYVVKHKV